MEHTYTSNQFRRAVSLQKCLWTVERKLELTENKFEIETFLLWVKMLTGALMRVHFVTNYIIIQ